MTPRDYLQLFPTRTKIILFLNNLSLGKLNVFFQTFFPASFAHFCLFKSISNRSTNLVQVMTVRIRLSYTNTLLDTQITTAINIISQKVVTVLLNSYLLVKIVTRIFCELGKQWKQIPRDIELQLQRSTFTEPVLQDQLFE